MVNGSPASRVDLVGQLVDAVAHARRDLAEPVRVHLDAGGLHLREHADERQLDLAEQPLEAELDEARPLSLGHAPREGGARGRGGLGRRPLDELGAVLGAGEREQRALLLRPLRREQVGGHGGVEGRPRRRVHEARLRLGVVHHGVPCQQPERAGPDRVGRRHQARVAAGVRGHDEAACVAVAARLEGERGLRLLEQGRHRPDVRLRREPHQRAADAGRRRLGRAGIARRSRAAGGAGCGTRSARRRRRPVSTGSRYPHVVTTSTRSCSSGTSQTMVASCSERRAAASCSTRSARRLSDLTSSSRRYISSMDPNCCSSCAAVFSPMPGTPGMLSEVSPLRPM